jgi:AcrR family transcriptional regulator
MAPSRGRAQPAENGTGPASERREAILALAAEVFAQKGFKTATVREIADAAGILSGSLYHHFDSKETMVDEIISRFINEMIASYTRIVEEIDDPMLALKALITTAFESIQPYRAAVTVAQNESHYLQQFARFSHLADGYARVERLWVGVLRRGIASGAFKPDLDTKLTYLFMRDAIWVTVRWFRPGGRYDVGQLADSYIDLVMAGIRTPAAVAGRRRSSAAKC